MNSVSYYLKIEFICESTINYSNIGFFDGLPEGNLLPKKDLSLFFNFQLESICQQFTAHLSDNQTNNSENMEVDE